MFLRTPEFQIRISQRHKKNLTLCDKTHSMGPSKQVRNEYLIRKNFLLRVNHDNNRKKAFLRLGQLKHHSLIKTFW